MQRWSGRVAVVTGASAGIGAAVAAQLQDAGLTVVALDLSAHGIQEAVAAARRAAEERGRGPAHRAPGPGPLHPLQCDVGREEDVLRAFAWVRDSLGGVDVLVNNAGVAGRTAPSIMDTADWRRILDINVLGLSLCTREALKLMREKGVDDGHIVHMSRFHLRMRSLAAHVPPPTPRMAIYSASKHAVQVLLEGLRKELVAAGSRIRVSAVCPGTVRTDIYNTLNMDMEALWQHPHLQPEDVADCVLFALAAPQHVQVYEMTVLPTGQVPLSVSNKPKPKP